MISYTELLCLFYTISNQNFRANILLNFELKMLCIVDIEVIICFRFTTNPDDVDPQFRLFLSSRPDPSFPVSILQTGIKVKS